MQPDKEVKVFREMPEQIREVTKVEGSVVFYCGQPTTVLRRLVHVRVKELLEPFGFAH